MKQEQLAWLAHNPFYTKRFAYFVGRRCRAATIQAVAKELALDWKTVKELDKQLPNFTRRIETFIKVALLQSVWVKLGN